MPLQRLRRKLTIRNQVLLVACFVFAGLAATEYLVQSRLLLPHFAQIERDQAYAAMDRVSDALGRELESFATSARDWGNWAETYDFMRGRSAGFLDKNVNADSLRDIHANVVAFIANDGRIVASAAYARAGGSPLQMDFLSAGRLAPDTPLLGAIGKRTHVTGLMHTNHGPLLVAAAPVLDGSGKGDVAGMIILGRFLSTVELAHMANLPSSALRRATDADDVGAATVRGATDGAAAPDDRVRETETTTFLYRDLHDLAGRTVTTLRLEAPREISASAQHTILVATLLLVVLAGTALLALVFYLDRAVLGPLDEITDHAVQIGDSDDLSRRLGREGHDELAKLSHAFDQMVARLARTRSELIDKSFDAGIAEMASGALHNLGNALTPLSVRVNSLEATLRQAPVADMERVVAELDLGDIDAQRRADLEQFSLLVGSELAHGVVAARADCDAAARQLQAIQRILTDQVRQSRAGAVLESVRLDALLAQSAELVAPAKRQHLALEISADIAQLPTLRLPATLLRQVFQNLIVNAAEAMHARDGRLSISAEIISDGGRSLLSCRFQDDGAGIAPEVLPRLFERRFSTKSSDTNSGIGLHWCANAMRGLGGEIRVTSDGPGTGACFHVVVPLKAETIIDAARAA